MTEPPPSLCDDYRLLDFGDGRRLERFGEIVLDRPCPAAEGIQRADPAAWAAADARFEGHEEEKGQWTQRRELPARWTVAFGPLRFELKRTDFGHVGLFPEQAANWAWIGKVGGAERREGRAKAGEGQRLRMRPDLVSRRQHYLGRSYWIVKDPVGLNYYRFQEEEFAILQMLDGETNLDDITDRFEEEFPPQKITLEELQQFLGTLHRSGLVVADLPGQGRQLCKGDKVARPRILNLFAYTGGSTMAAAAAGAEVVHVDAAKNIVAWARRNAELTGLADAPIHWIVEDAQKFVKRELRRGNRYDGLILDPPSYGHGRRGEVWRLSRHLPQLLSAGRGLLAGRRAFVLLTCHTPAYGVAALRDMMLAALGHDGVITGDPLVLRSVAGRELPSGVAVRWMKQ